jgi:hypothetical protein
LTTEENHQNILKGFTSSEQETLEEMMKSVKLGDIPLRIFQQMYVMDEPYIELSREDDDLLEEYKDRLEKSNILISESL